MSSLLAVYRSDETQDYLKRRYYNNFEWSLSFSRDKYLLPFIIDGSKYGISFTGSVTDFELRRVDPSNPTTILTTNDLTTARITINPAGGGLQDYVYYANDSTITSYPDGTYQYYIKDSNGNEFTTGYFCHKEVSLTDGDFNDDFNEDFFLYSIDSMDLVKLEVWNLSGIYQKDYVDKVYLPYELIKESKEILNNRTDEVYGSIYDNVVEQRLIQSVSYNVYETNILMSESQGYENINSARNVRITDANNNIYLCDITEPIEPEKEEDNNYNQVFRLKFKDINPNNYPGGLQPIINLYSSDTVSIENAGFPNNMWILKLESTSSLGSYWDTLTSSTNIFSLYSALIPKTTSNESEYTTPNQGGTILIQSQTEKIAKTVLYLTEKQALDLQTYIKKVDKIYLTKGGVGYDNETYTSNIQISVSQGKLYDLYKCEISFTYDIIIKAFRNDTLPDYVAQLNIGSEAYKTNILPYLSMKPVEVEDDDKLGSGEDIFGSYTTKQVYVCKFFLNGADLIAMVQNMYGRVIGDFSLEIKDVLTVASAEMIKAEHKAVEGMKDLHEVDINFTINVDKEYNNG